MSAAVRILFLADSHLGFDLPVRRIVQRRRRGDDFLANYATALAPALRGDVDLVVHGGDVFDRPRVPGSLAYQAFEPLVRVARAGVPVFVVPGNHERGRLPHARLAAHPLLHVFDRPRTFRLVVGGTSVALSGFPFERAAVRERFPGLLAATGASEIAATVRLLCMHQCVEGATVGPGDYTFRGADDVIRGSDVPAGYDAVLSGHIHRHQVLRSDLRGRPLAAPVMYSGSIERTSVAEADEPKGYMLLRARPGGGPEDLRWEFRHLPARPMIVTELDATSPPHALAAAIDSAIAAAPPDAVLRIRLRGELDAARSRLLSAARLRGLAPPTMNVEVSAASWAGRRPNEDAPAADQVVNRGRRSGPDAHWKRALADPLPLWSGLTPER